MVHGGGEQSAVRLCVRLSAGDEGSGQCGEAGSGDRGAWAGSGAQDVWLPDHDLQRNGRHDFIYE